MEGFIGLIALIAFVRHVGKWIMQRRRQPVEWSSTVRVGLSINLAREAIAEHLRAQGYRLVNTDRGIEVYSRGDPSIRRLPTSRDLSSSEIPILIAVAGQSAGEQTVIAMTFRALPRMATEGAAAAFREYASLEFADVTELLEHLAERHADPKPRQPPSHEPENIRAEAPLSADFNALGLKPGASWANVQAAYREACKKYHPDRLTGQNVAPHLVELAVQRFNSISEAYQRLKAHMATAAGGS